MAVLLMAVLLMAVLLTAVLLMVADSQTVAESSTTVEIT